MALINVVKKIEKARVALDIPSDEQIVAACTTNPKGNMRRTMAVGLGGVVGAAIASRGQSTVTTEASASQGMAERFVAGQNALVLTDRRLFLATLSAMTGKPKAIVAAWPREAIASITVEENKLSYPMTITYTDGSIVEVEGAKGTDPRALAV